MRGCEGPLSPRGRTGVLDLCLSEEFVAALAGVGASDGIFITTSRFSTDALKYVEPSPVILIDGNRLGQLMA
ncbi:MAG: restriction endonuclease [Actinobacteria bacterium]|nr:MAG: restriction endonuclease [Actinomycetota bacterium]